MWCLTSLAVAVCFILQRGRAVEVNHKLSLELFRRAAELGDPQAQGMMGMRMAVGLHHYHSFKGASIRQFGPVSSPTSPAAHRLHSIIWAGPIRLIKAALMTNVGPAPKSSSATTHGGHRSEVSN